MSARKSGFLLGLIGAVIMGSCSGPGRAESVSALRGWMLYTPDVLCWVTKQAEVICIPPQSAAIIEKADIYLQARQITVTPDNALFTNGFETLAQSAPAPVQ